MGLWVRKWLQLERLPLLLPPGIMLGRISLLFWRGNQEERLGKFDPKLESICGAFDEKEDAKKEAEGAQEQGT